MEMSSLSKRPVGDLSITAALYIRKMVQGQTQKYLLEKYLRWKFCKNDGIQGAWRPRRTDSWQGYSCAHSPYNDEL